MKKILALMLCGLLLGASALAEGAYFSSLPEGGLTELDGQVYGLSGYEGFLGAATPAVEKWSATGQRTRVGQNSALNSEIRSIHAAGDALLIVREEKGWLELLDPMADMTCRADLWYPATRRRVRVDGDVFAMQGKLYRERDGWLQQLSADGREVAQAWPGRVFRDWKPLQWDSFLLLQDGERLLALEATTLVCWDVTALRPDFSRDTEAVLEDGVMYLLEDDSLTAIDLRDGTRRTLLTFPEEAYGAFMLDAQRIILLGSKVRGEPAASAVYDRATLQCTMVFTHRTSPVDALVTGDLLYMRDPYDYVHLGAKESWSDPASASIVDLTTGDEVYWTLDAWK